MIVAVTVLSVACTSTDLPAPSGQPAATGAPIGPSSYATIAELHDAVVAAGFACTLEYPGLRDDVTNNEVSICTIDGETAYLTVWGSADDLTAFAASPDGATGTVALGADWSIAVSTGALATRLAAGLGGSAPVPSDPTSPS